MKRIGRLYVRILTYLCETRNKAGKFVVLFRIIVIQTLLSDLITFKSNRFFPFHTEIGLNISNVLVALVHRSQGLCLTMCHLYFMMKPCNWHV